MAAADAAAMSKAAEACQAQDASAPTATDAAAMAQLSGRVSLRAAAMAFG